MKRILALIMAAAAACCGVAADVYQITGNVTEGIDLVGGGYATDRLAGPSGADASVGGTITHADGLTTGNPFQLIGYGKKVTFTSNTGLELVPLKMRRAEGVSGQTVWTWKNAVKFRGGLELDHQRLDIPYLDWGGGGITVCGDGSSSVALRLDNSTISAYGRTTIGTVEGDASFVLKDSTYMAQDNGGYDIYLGTEASPGRTGIRVSMSMENSNVTVYQLVLMSGVVGSKAENCFVTNGMNSTLKALKITHTGGDYSRFTFNGGRFVSVKSSTDPLFHVGAASWKSGFYPEPKMQVEGVAGNPIDIEISYDRNLSGGDKGRRVSFSGNGGFVKRGAGILTWTRVDCDYWWDSSLVSLCTYTGDTVVKGGGIKQSVGDFLPGRGALSLEAAGTTFDLNGIGNKLFTGVTGFGSVINSSATSATLSLGYNNASGDWNAAVAASVPVEKIGTGTLTIGTNAASYSGDFTVSAGTAKLAVGVSAISFGTVTIAAGATLDIRGAAFKCVKLVNNGTLLTDDDSTLTLNIDEDTDLARAGFSGKIEKTGSAKLTLRGGLEKVSELNVAEGTLRYIPATFSGKYFKLVFGGSSNYDAITLGEISLYDAAGNRVNQGSYTYNCITKQGTQREGLNTLEGIAASETALMGAGSGYFHAHNNGEGPDKLFDGDPVTFCCLRYSWGNSAVGFRIADNAAPIVGYTLTACGNDAYIPNHVLNKWRLYGSTNGKDWVLLDDRSAEAQAVPTTKSTVYNNGVPYPIAEGLDPAAPIVADDGIIRVASGATLDPASALAGIRNLAIDCTTGAGTITCFSPVADGALYLTGLDKSALGNVYLLPITINTLANRTNLRSWKVYVNGEEVDNRVRYVGGRLAVCGVGLVMVIK